MIVFSVVTTVVLCDCVWFVLILVGLLFNDSVISLRTMLLLVR